MTEPTFTAADLDQLRARGIPVAEAERQLELLRRPPRYADVVRPCTVGDGIERVAREDEESLILLHEQAAAQGRVTKLVPASGAATRMFQDLLAGNELAARAFAESVDRFAFAEDLKRAASRFGGGVVEALLSREGLGYAELPKALFPFHRYPDGPRTALEDQLGDAAGFAADANGRCRVHFTASPEHRAKVEARLETVRSALEARRGVRFDVTFSAQKPSTDTLAAAPDGAPFRDSAGSLLFRPAGHGALIENLADLGGDIVFVKNIDNIVPEDRQPLVVRWKKILGGWLAGLQREAFVHAARMRSEAPEGWAVDEASAFVKRRLGLSPPPSVPDAMAWLRSMLERPIRVCGVVRNTGEPGGGPFWVRRADGTAARQIVESAEFDPASGAHRAIFRSATHFNPVDLVCGMRDAAGKPFDLHWFVDPDAVIVARKSHEGRELLALERPGLWNGAMAGWNTVFVEVPGETFAPVKTVMDLLRPEHQP